MPAGYRNSAGIDFDDLFDPYEQGEKPAPTGYRTSDGADLCERYAPIAFGSKGPDVGYRNSAGVDLSNLWAAKGSGSGAFSATASKSFLSGDWPEETPGTLSDSVTIICSGGSGSYSIVSVSHTGGVVSTSISGLTVTANAYGLNTTRAGTLTIVVTDGFSQITLYVDYEFVFGTGL